jgi:hypothetical protein
MLIILSVAACMAAGTLSGPPARHHMALAAQR